MTKSLTLRVGRRELNVRGYSAVLQRKYGLDQTRNTGSSFSMSNIWFDLDQIVRISTIEDRNGSLTEPIYTPEPSKTLPIATVSSGSPTAVPVP